ncbi:MAG: hypothetical protein SGILL_009728 [Bacillariaceae sp.]
MARRQTTPEEGDVESATSKSIEHDDLSAEHADDCCCDPPECCCTQDCCCECKACQPFKDWYLFSAQLLSVANLCLSWYWYIPLILSAVVAAFLQLAWCCRMRKGGFWAITVLSGMNFISSMAAAIIMDQHCVETLTLYNHAYVPHDFYNLKDISDNYGCYDETGFIIVASLSAVVSVVVTCLLAYFLMSGRHEQCMKASRKR